LREVRTGKRTTSKGEEANQNRKLNYWVFILAL